MTGFGNTKVTISIVCNNCNRLQKSIVIKHRQLHSWVQGAKIQDAMPELTPAERELLISATCDTCFQKMFAGGEE
jgi:hypothetical protein